MLFRAYNLVIKRITRNDAKLVKTKTEISKIKTKLSNTCEKYCNIKVSYPQRKIISNLSKSVEPDPTKTLETKMQQVLRKIKSKVSEQEYKRVYPTGSGQGKFYGTAKMHKLSLNGNVNDLPLRPIASNINVTTYNLAKFLSKLLAPLRESKYTVKNTKNFVDDIKKENIQNGYKMISFEVKS